MAEQSTTFSSEIPTNEGNIDKMMKIMNAARFSSGFGNEELAEETSAITTEVMTDIQTEVIDPDYENMGFFEVPLQNGEMTINSYQKMNFDAESGFSLRKNYISEKEIVIEHDSFKTILVNGQQVLTAKKSDTINLVVEGLEATALIDGEGNKIIHLKNKYTKLSELDDVEFSDEKGNTDLLTVKNGKVTDIDLEEVTEIPPSVITGGTF